LPIDLLRADLQRIWAEAPEWDGRVAALQGARTAGRVRAA
jgi:hypothetical protein